MPDDRIKRPAYQWYVNDARGDEVFMLMSYEQQGIYRALLDHQWIEGSIPADPLRICHLLKTVQPKRFQRLWPLISHKFRVCGDDRLINDRLEAQRKHLDLFIGHQREKGRKSALKRTEASTAVQPRFNSSTSTSSSTSTKNKGGSAPAHEHQPEAPPRTPTDPHDPRTSTRSTIRTSAPLVPLSSHRSHALCGVICLPSAMWEDFVRRSRHQPDPEGYVTEFFHTWDTRYVTGDRAKDTISEDAFDFWRQRWAETHPATKPEVDVTALAKAKYDADQARWGKR